jgi:DNA-binding IscR family transcriptional regulator
LIGILRKNGLVTSSKGKNGGYVLARPPKKITAGEVIEIMEGQMVPKCYGNSCEHMENCASSFVWIKLGEQIKKTLYSIKLSDLVEIVIYILCHFRESGNLVLNLLDFTLDSRLQGNEIIWQKKYI